MCYILPKITDPWYFVLVISTPEYILTYAKKQRFYLAWFLKIMFISCFLFHFWQKSYILPQNDGIVIFYMLINHYISINDLTRKVILGDIPTFLFFLSRMDGQTDSTTDGQMQTWWQYPLVRLRGRHAKIKISFYTKFVICRPGT